MASISIEPGFRLGKYEVMEHLATGGMGAVYKAVDRDLGRLVALKILYDHLMENDVAIERFRREARHIARLSHPNIVALYDFNHDTRRNLRYIALEFVNGVDLAHHLAKRGQLRPEETRRIVIHVARALRHAFERGVIHRDIKPSNIMLARVGRKLAVKLTDFGLAIRPCEEEFRVTREGSTVGTIDYMAPEQARDSRACDTRSDIYSLGCTAYHMLAGRAPFGEGGLGERLFKHLQVAPADIRVFNPAVTPEFWAILEKMLAKDPADRFVDPDELLEALRGTPANSGKSSGGRLAVHSGMRQTKHGRTEPTRISIPAVVEKPGVAAGAVTTEQARAAAATYDHALHVSTRSGDGESYARELLENCLRLNPFDIAARKALRGLNQKCRANMLTCWFGTLNVLAIKSKMRYARSAGDWRKVLEHGEQVLAYQPDDADTHLELAKTATEIGLPALARWFLEQACQQAPTNPELVRALARLHEFLRDWKPAIALWQQVLALEPDNVEAHRKITDLSAQDLLAEGNYAS